MFQYNIVLNKINNYLSIVLDFKSTNEQRKEAEKVFIK